MRVCLKFKIDNIVLIRQYRAEHEISQSQHCDTLEIDSQYVWMKPNHEKYICLVNKFYKLSTD